MAFPHEPVSGRRAEILRVRDGRTLCYADYGDPAGPVLFYFHGHPGSRCC
jgi:hypothetical protein